MKSMSASEVREKWSQVLREVEENGLRLEVTHHGRPVAELVPPRTNTAFAGRLRWLFAEMGGGPSSLFAEMLELPTLGALTPYLEGETDPAREFCQKIADRFRINEQWLMHGSENPFKTIDCDAMDDNFFERMKLQKPKQVFFCMEDPSRQDKEHDFKGTASMVFGWDEKTYQAVSARVHISSFNGNSGYSRLRSFRKLCASFSTMRHNGISPFGLILPKKDLEEVIQGARWAGIVKKVGTHSYWWDDFVDIIHYYPIAENYEYHYGKAFIEAQKELKFIIEQEEKEKGLSSSEVRKDSCENGQQRERSAEEHYSLVDQY